MEKQKLLEQVEFVLDEKIRPALQMHAGGIDVIDFDESTGTLKIRMKGTCHGCGFANETLYGFVEEELRANLPDISIVESADEEIERQDDQDDESL